MTVQGPVEGRLRGMSGVAGAAVLLLVTALLLVACGPPGPATRGLAVSGTPRAAAARPASPGPAATPNPFAGVPGIVTPDNRGWPREVQGLNGRVVIAAKPERIHTLSLGLDEVTFALVPASRVVAVGTYTKDLASSNVADLAKDTPGIGRDPEAIVARRPDIVLADPYADPGLLQALHNAGVTVVQLAMHNDPAGRIQDILLLGYVYGEEARAVQLAGEVQARYGALTALTQRQRGARPGVLSLTSYAGTLYTAGRDSTEGGIIETAGGVNVAAKAGLERNPKTSLEGVVALAPDVIVIPQAEGGDDLRQQLLGNPALAQVPAIKARRVYVVPAKYFTTLSFWNLRGAEELAKLLWPDDFAGKTFPPFSLPAQAP